MRLADTEDILNNSTPMDFLSKIGMWGKKSLLLSNEKFRASWSFNFIPKNSLSEKK